MKLISTLCCILVTSQVYAQQKKNYFPVWTYQQSNTNIHGVSGGLFPMEPARNTTTNGIRLELIGGGIVAPLVPASPVAEDDSSFRETEQRIRTLERLNGISLSAGGAMACSINGVAINGIGQVAPRVNGLSVALMVNFADLHNGIQIGTINMAYKMNGIQIGFRNRSKRTRGLQIGLWNENEKRNLPLLNWNFRS